MVSPPVVWLQTANMDHSGEKVTVLEELVFCEFVYPKTQHPKCPCTEFLRPTSTVLVAEIREPPHVAQADSKSHTGHDEVHLSGPGFSFRHLYDHGPVSCPTCSPVLGLRWTTALNTCWNPSRHGHERVSRAAFLLGHRSCLQLGKIHCS